MENDPGQSSRYITHRDAVERQCSIDRPCRQIWDKALKNDMQTGKSDAASGEFETKPGVKLPQTEDPRPKRFYKTVTVEAGEGGAWRVLLDGRGVKSPARKELALPTKAAAEIIAAEWAAQGEHIDAPTMPASRLAFVTIDRMAEARAETAAEVAKYASTDLLCFRAAEPTDLVLAQNAAWNPLLDWAASELGVTLKAVAGIMPVEQDPVALHTVLTRAVSLDDWKLTALAHTTAVCGSAVLGLALLERRIDGAQAHALSTVDEVYQAAHWGADEDAAARNAILRAELVVVGNWLRALDA
jgi:chaperone required for assembly of F1-ATPase